MWLMVCRWPQSQESNWAKPHLCKLARHRPWLSGNGSSETMYDEGDWNLAVSLVGSVTIVWLTSEADDQSSLHCVRPIVSTDSAGASKQGGGEKRVLVVTWRAPRIETLETSRRWGMGRGYIYLQLFHTVGSPKSTADLQTETINWWAQEIRQSVNYFTLGIGGALLWQRVSSCVCSSVCLSASTSPELGIRSSPIFVRVTYGRGSALFWWRCDNLCPFGFMGDVIFAHS